jgi:hypothetical protein
MFEMQPLPHTSVIPGRRASGEPGVQTATLARSAQHVMAGLIPRLSGLILVDAAHGMDSSVF